MPEIQKHPEIALTPCSSSLIFAHGYDAATRTLALQFRKKGKKPEDDLPGATYHYADVEPEMYDGLCKAESVGRFFGEKVKNKPEHPHTRIAEPPAPEPDQQQAA